jgi:hypothetical protein
MPQDNAAHGQPEPPQVGAITLLSAVLVVVDQFREVLDGRRDAWFSEIVAMLTAALADLQLHKPADLTDGQELMARYDALGLSAYTWRGPSDTCPTDLRRELLKVERRAAELKAMREQGRWNP